MTTTQKLELMKEIDRRNSQHIADYQAAAQIVAKPSGNDAA